MAGIELVGFERGPKSFTPYAACLCTEPQPGTTFHARVEVMKAKLHQHSQRGVDFRRKPELHAHATISGISAGSSQLGLATRLTCAKAGLHIPQPDLYMSALHFSQHMCRRRKEQGYGRFTHNRRA